MKRKWPYVLTAILAVVAVAFGVLCFLNYHEHEGIIIIVASIVLFVSSLLLIKTDAKPKARKDDFIAAVVVDGICKWGDEHLGASRLELGKEKLRVTSSKGMVRELTYEALQVMESPVRQRIVLSAGGEEIRFTANFASEAEDIWAFLETKSQNF